MIPGTALAAYGHGDWNDSLQPADPMMRERMCSAWTVTLHFQMLNQLAQALRGIGRSAEAEALESEAKIVARDFQRLLLVNNVLTGYALFEHDGRVRYLLHPTDDSTGVHYSSLAMIHAILEDLLTPAQAREHLRLISATSQRAGRRQAVRSPAAVSRRSADSLPESRERHVLRARDRAHVYARPSSLRAGTGARGRCGRVFPGAVPGQPDRHSLDDSQRNAAAGPTVYYSSSDAQFADRYQASDEYARVGEGTIPFDGGWRVYSSGAGIAVGLIIRRLFGLSVEAEALRIDPVIPTALDGWRSRHHCSAGRSKSTIALASRAVA